MKKTFNIGDTVHLKQSWQGIVTGVIKYISYNHNIIVELRPGLELAFWPCDFIE